MGRDSNAHTVSIIAPPSTSLEAAGNAIAANSWVSFPLPNQNAIFGSQIGGTGSIAKYANQAVWIPQSRRVGFVGSDHTGTSLTDFVWYDEVAHACARTTQPVPIIPGLAHGFCHNAVNPYTGDFYFTEFNGGGNVWWKPYASTNFVLKTTAPLNKTGILQPSCWWSGTFVGGGAQGCLVLWNESSLNGLICAYNPLTNSWWSQSGRTPNHSEQYNGLIAYSAVKNCALLGGGNSAPTKVYRLNSDGTTTIMPDVPAGRNFNVGHGYVEADKGTGNFLHLWGSELWELNPDGAGSWSQISTAVPSALTPTGESAAGGQSSLICAIPPHNGLVNNLIMFIKQDASADAACFLYRRA